MQATKIAWATHKPIPEFPSYSVTPDGTVLSAKQGGLRALKPIASKDGHLYVFLYRGGQMHKMWLHKAVLLAYVGPPAEGQECRHLDGVPSRNHLDNLRWGTRQENADDKQRHGTQQRGEKSGTHKLTEVDVLEIRQRIGTMPLRALAKEYGVSHTAIRRAALGIKWAHLGVA